MPPAVHGRRPTNLSQPTALHQESTRGTPRRRHLGHLLNADARLAAHGKRLNDRIEGRSDGGLTLQGLSASTLGRRRG
jgi:hypothetical protein